VIAVEYHSDLKEVQSDARLAALLSAQEQRAPFDRLEWWQGLTRHCGLHPLLAVAREGDALAALPLQGSDDHLTALANWYSFRVRPIVSAEADRRRLLTAIARDLGKRARRITLAGLPDEDGSASAVAQAFREAGWIVLREPCDTNHVLAPRGRSYDDYLATRPGKLRTTLKRKSGKIETDIILFFNDDRWKTYESIYGQSWKPDEGSPAFLRAFAEAEGAAGRLRLGIARADGEPVAAQMWTVEGGTAFIHKLAYVESARALSPGSVLSAALLRHVIDIDKVSLVDFGTGDDAYKRDWMEKSRPRYRLDMLRPLAPRNWMVFAKTGLRRLAGQPNHG
jgi:CelD/BcsL family acetyltransferase involved in cellulose biosynthesis